jgi:putative DNA primase/helicase
LTSSIWRLTEAATIGGPNLDLLHAHAHEDDIDSFKLAREYLKPYLRSDALAERYYRAEHYRWTGVAYQAVPEKEHRAEVAASVKRQIDDVNNARYANYQAAVQRQQGEASSAEPPKPPKAISPSVKLLSDVEMAVRTISELQSEVVEPPAWLVHGAPFPADDVLVARNGLLHLPSLIAHGPSLAPLTPAFFSTIALDYDFDPRSKRPDRFLNFLDELWPGDGQSIDCLQEVFGYLLTPDTSQQKIFLVIGPKRSGKGTLLRILSRLVGAGNVASPTLSSLGTTFGLQPLLRKTVATITDARLSARTDTATVIERLLSISGEDAVTVDRKFLETLTVKLPTRFIIVSNELPRLGDASGAMAGRFITLRLARSWYGKEDHGLFDSLLPVLPGILLWAIQGWKNLRQRGHFVQPASAEELQRDLEDLGSPVAAFVRERCIIDPAGEIPVGDLFDVWCGWCVEKKKKETGTEQTFGRDLRAACPGIDTKQKGKDATGKRPRVYVGIRLRTSADNDQ